MYTQSKRILDFFFPLVLKQGAKGITTTKNYYISSLTILLFLLILLLIVTIF